MKILHVNIVGKVATYCKRDGDIVCGNSDYQIKFTFDTEWDEHTEKTARFIWGGKYRDVDFTGDTCEVPIIQGASMVEVGVYAGDLNTTTSAIIMAKRSILCSGATPSTENDGTYANEAKAAAERAEAAAERAEATAEVVEIVADNSKGFYNMMAELHKDIATFIPWITEPETDEDGEFADAESLYDYLRNDDFNVGIKPNVAFPPTFTKIPRLYDDFGGDRKMWRIDNIWIPSTVTTIGRFAFEYCYGTILIPATVEKIEYRAFNAREYLDDEQEGNEYEEGFTEGDYFPVTIDLTEFKTEPFPVAEPQNFDECMVVKVCKGRGAELAKMTNWADVRDYIVEV